MADSIGGEIQGLESVIGKLKSLEQLPREKSTRFALRKAANLVRDAAQANAARLDDPQTSENIAENIVVRQDKKRYRRGDEIKMRVGVMGGATHVAAAVGEVAGQGKGNPGGDTYYWRFLEFGTEKMAAQPFMRPALESNQGAATNEFVTHFDKAIVRAIKRANKAKAR
ncbi:HK97 gp10 family phage protein [Halomonas sp. EGI 63088]|uniref:HK97 gp10 family phage protein n=1 Tax=Halomonas flagellata TaxID=2920385 RepID=A0ABS9RU22_9GAMM|nr:HK97-gp10 family putative phage morphogenesis protein [Halomonas flagellata]MCH4563347.1 HK97 gp10 family phage protein [Halomonas flagellata]